MTVDRPDAAIADLRLGRNFWLFQVGQMISTIGDACGNVALAWWILDVTGLPAQVSAVLAPAMVVQAMLTPLMGPLGDRFSRRHLILISDVVRAAMILLLALLALTDQFALPTVIAIYIVFVIGSALFASNNMSIVPQLVSAGALQTAVRTSESMQAIGRVGGGIIGGVIVSTAGVGVAFLLDGISFSIAVIATFLISPLSRHASPATPTTARHLAQELADGFRMTARIPVLLWLCVAIAVFNLVLNPMQVLLPTYAKLERGMPAWFLGGLESAMGAGILVGAVLVGSLERRLRRISSVVVGLVCLGGGLAFLAHVPGVVPPMTLMFAVGVGAAWTNIPISTRVAVAVPDHYRSRVNSIVAFLFNATAPLGVAAAGPMVALFGVAPSMTALGATVILAVPLLFLVPDFSTFFRRTPAELTNYFLLTYPQAFRDRPAPPPEPARSQPHSS
ncbi:MAG TPA: MFS transporter [Vicinamibacterales bacterium]|nr:MFS transporter [Vicinamibacterales bacterium]